MIINNITKEHSFHNMNYTIHNLKTSKKFMDEVKKDMNHNLTQDIIKQLTSLLTNVFFSKSMSNNMFTNQNNEFYKDILFKEYTDIITKELNLTDHLYKTNE